MADAAPARGRSTRSLPTHRSNFPRRHSFLVVRRHTNTTDITYSSDSKNPSTRTGNTPDSNLFIDFRGMRNPGRGDCNRLRATLSDAKNYKFLFFIQWFDRFQSVN
ncbi:hypothetical protein [Burkholderia sp. ABCPW 11]|uniref:hypothetical protein n=1 Tax=Burkholderia sp. ABCPW 11 TaxID=1637859 RepID=UPI0015D0C616|nr:hypothetical protein [Burkholderia sp. ABCPW 11]